MGLVITNLFDTDPPFDNSTNGLSSQSGGSGVSGTANGTTLGRYFEITLTKTF